MEFPHAEPSAAEPRSWRGWLVAAVALLLISSGFAVDRYVRVAEVAARAERREAAVALTLGVASLGVAVALAFAGRGVKRHLDARRRAIARLAAERRVAQQAAAAAGQERERLLADERAAREQAERAMRLKDEFVSALSHELRTPLNAMLGWIGILKHNRSPETIEKAIDVLDRNSRRQSRIIDDLLDMSRVMSGKLRLDVQRVDMAAVVDEAVTSAAPAAEAKGVRVVKALGVAPLVNGDPGRLQQIVWNLLTNAIRFTPRGGEVRITLRHADQHLVLEVADTGQGVEADMLPHVFERFRQGDPTTTRQHGGLGLGLAIVKSFVEMHGGSVGAASEGAGRGSTFWVRLPVATKPIVRARLRASIDAVPGGASLLTGTRVLVVDDEPDARELVERLLGDAGSEVRAAASAREASGVLDAGFAPDVIVSDIGMPEQDGYAFLRDVRARPGSVATVPAVALTAFARVEDRRRALLAGYQTHLAKPVDPSELVALVASLAGRTGRVA